MLVAIGTPTAPSATLSVSPMTGRRNFIRRASPGSARTNSLEMFQKVDDYTIAIYMTCRHTLSLQRGDWMVILKCALEAAGNDHEAYTKSPSGTGPYKFDRVAPATRAGEEPGLLEQGSHSQP